MMTLAQLCAAAGPELLLLDAVAPAWAELRVSDVICDSRQAAPGRLFVAVPGLRADGMRFAADAFAAGAVGVIAAVDADCSGLPEDAVVLRTPSPRRAVGLLAAALRGVPSRRIAVCAVTGTNGKSTTAILLAQLLTAAGRRAAALGTLGLWTPEGLQPGGLTTPDGADLQRRLAELADAGFEAVALEASSHALDQERLVGTELATIAWTNLSRDHLDYHGDMASYAAAKAKLFEAFGVPPERAFSNVDDAYAAGVVSRGLAEGFGFGRPASPAAVATHRVAGVRGGRGGVELTINHAPAGDHASPPLSLQTPLLGAHNAENLTAAALMARALGVSDAAIAAAARSLRAPRGRLEPVANGLGALALVDYAHTPDALDASLRVCRELVGPGGRLTVVFGCGGDRDAGKRPEMGRVAAQQADLAVLTSDNPRSEPPAAIVAAIEAGAAAAGARRLERLVPSTLAEAGAAYVVEVERDVAIRRAVGTLQGGDVLLVAGKGHETTQTIGADVLPFDDRERLEHWLGQRRGGKAEPVASAGTDIAATGPRVDAATAAALTGGALLVDAARAAHGVGSDSRAVAPGSVFVALRGERFDGHAFAAAAIEQGAAGVVVERGEGAALIAGAQARGAFVLEVEDSLQALGDLAAGHRRAMPARVVGITGSNGKTSTKELTALALAAAGPVHATLANHNNRIGVPQTVFGIGAEHRFAVVEMGMSIPGEIAKLAAIGSPEVGVITSIGEAHLEGLGSVAAIAKEKASLLHALGPGQQAIAPFGVAVLEPELVGLRAELLRFGLRGGDVRALAEVEVGLGADGTPWQRVPVDVLGTRLTLELPALGVHMAHNALAALAVAAVLGVDLQAAAWQLRRYAPVGQRMRPRQLGGVLLLEDCYNANPSSVEVALETLRSCVGPRIAVLGEMRELGPDAEALHRRVARAAVGLDALVAVGPFAAAMASEARAVGVASEAFGADAVDATAAAAAAALAGAGTVLVKGSRGARLERVVDALAQQLARQEVA